jgi:hypothetical protein
LKRIKNLLTLGVELFNSLHSAFLASITAQSNSVSIIGLTTSESLKNNFVIVLTGNLNAAVYGFLSLQESDLLE